MRPIPATMEDRIVSNMKSMESLAPFSMSSYNSSRVTDPRKMCLILKLIFSFVFCFGDSGSSGFGKVASTGMRIMRHSSLLLMLRWRASRSSCWLSMSTRMRLVMRTSSFL